MLQKAKGQRTNTVNVEPLAFILVGVREGSRLGILGARSWGFNSPHVHFAVTVAQPVERPICNRVYAGSYPLRHPQLTPRRQLVAGNGAYPRAEAKGQGCYTAVILAHRPGESKGQNDVPQLQDRMQEIRKDPQRPATVSLFRVSQDLL